MRYRKIVALAILFCSWCIDAPAITEPKEGGFVSTKFSKVNLRSGPGLNYPVKFVYARRNLPLKKIGVFDDWYKVKDIEGDVGWVKFNVVSSKRYVMTTKSAFGYSKSTEQSDLRATFEPSVICELLSCANNWCQIKSSKNKFWVKKSVLWGTSDDE